MWALKYDGFDPQNEPLREALCTLGNGYFATRGAAPESVADGLHYPGTYIAGCYNRLTTLVSGQSIENEDLVNVPNWLCLYFRIDDADWFDVQKVEVLEYRQELDLRAGVLSRLVRFEDEAGRRTRLFQRRFVHMSQPHLAGLETTFVAENWSGDLIVRTALDGTVANTGVKRYRQLNHRHLRPVATGVVDRDTIFLQVETSQSHIRIAEGARTQVFCNGACMQTEPETIQRQDYIGQDLRVHLEEDTPVTVEKIVSIYTSRDMAISECGLEARKDIGRAPCFAELLESHVLAWDHLWQDCRIGMDGGERGALILNIHIFHLLQTVSKNTIDLDVGVPARGLHGEAYRGHIFWDELFIFPFLNLRLPELTRTLLQYRYRRLKEARQAAHQAGYEGAVFPWQSSSDGREESQTLHLNPRSGRWIPDNSRLQRHINIAIAYNIWFYYEVTADLSFLASYGAEMLIEIARFWASIAEYNRSLGRYEIKGVMGPDEYHDSYPGSQSPGLNNNAYTNIMAVWTFGKALEALEVLPEEGRQFLREKLSLTRQEQDRWNDISNKMRVVFHDDGIISQFEGYDSLQEFDWEGYRSKYGDIQRLDRILEAEGDTPNRYKVSKQADVLMLFYLLSADELRHLFTRLGYAFEYDTIPKNIDYYTRRTSHGSTLSRVVHSWVLARSEREESWHLFKRALESDVSDIQGGTTSEGIHLGAMAGTVDLVQRCYTGIETQDNMLRFNPTLPDSLRQLVFHVHYRGHHVAVQLTSDKLVLGIREGAHPPITIGVRDDLIEMKPGETREFTL
ncbi:MAG: glycoside hydrolase family 65 protein [Chloroflexota bacterium]